MSSPFQKQFSSKSPLNGNYYSGVDGLQYVSPKIPESKTPADPKTKLPKTPERRKKFDFGPTDLDTSITPPESDFKFDGNIPETPADVESKREEFKNLQTVKRLVPGAKVEKVEKNKEKYLASFEPGFARDPEGTTTCLLYTSPSPRD